MKKITNKDVKNLHQCMHILNDLLAGKKLDLGLDRKLESNGFVVRGSGSPNKYPVNYCQIYISVRGTWTVADQSHRFLYRASGPPASEEFPK